MLYDASGPWAHLGELYAIQLVNLASHFGAWRAKPVERYASSDADGVRAVLYIGSTHGEPLPRSFVDDVLADHWPIVWIDENVWQLIERYPFFTERYGWVRGRPDVSPVRAVRYRQTDLPRDPAAQPEGIATFRFVDKQKVTIVAEAVRADGTTIPWAVRSSNLVYVAENPFRYTSDSDRQLVLADLLFDLLAPDTPVRHRALLRLEDINPRSDPAELRALGARLAARAIPFGFAVYPVHRAPGAREVRLCERPAVVAAIRALTALGGTMVAHGFSHQHGTAPNPYDGRSGNDYEFFRADLGERGEPRLLGPVDGDSEAWANGLIAAAAGDLSMADLRLPAIFEVPHYAASAAAYAVFAVRFAARWDRGLYFAGTLAGGPIDHERFVSQAFPFVVRDVYGSTVIPENLGHHTTRPADWRSGGDAVDIVAAARRALVVRDGFASFFYHPYHGGQPLEAIIDDIEAAGYAFVSPASLEAPGASRRVEPDAQRLGED